MKTLLLGDLSPTAVTNPIFKEKNIELLFGDSVYLFRGNDVTFVNLECALTESDAAIDKFGPALKACAETAEVMKELGVNLVGLSNNHCFDYGCEGVRDTIATLERVGIPYTGFGNNYDDSIKNYVVEKDGEKVCFIAVCEHEYSYALENRMGSRPFDIIDTLDDIREAKKSADRVIVLYHGAKEMCQYPSPRLVKVCRAMARAGADVIIGQHSHCIGCYENYEGCHILYGEGNFHFSRVSSSPLWGDMLAVHYDTKTHEIEFTPICNSDTGIELTKGERKEKILREFEERKKQMLDGTWREGWHEFCESMRENYTGCIADAFAPEATDRQNHRFAHYLDCEAHHDVWVELFKTANHKNCID